MKKNKILFCALGLFAMAAALYAAPKTKDIYVSPDANGTLLTTDDKGLAYLELDKPVDFSGYKYVTYECSSPDGKKITYLYINTYYGEDDGDSHAPKSSTVCIPSISKNIEAYQTYVYGAVNKYYDYSNIDGRCDMRVADKTLCERIGVAVADKDWNWIPGIKIYIKKITATNSPIGKTCQVDLSKARFAAGTDWEKDWGCFVPLDDLVAALPKKGDSVVFNLKGNNVYGVKGLVLSIIEVNPDAASYNPVAQSVQVGDLPAGPIDVPVEFVVGKTASKLSITVSAYKDDNDGPFLILFE
ncbi:MAG: hypothetical protein IK015_11270 [Treponema sp.]|nr:hypothetical protein [Treponema sp.]